MQQLRASEPLRLPSHASPRSTRTHRLANDVLASFRVRRLFFVGFPLALDSLIELLGSEGVASLEIREALANEQATDCRG